MAEQDDVLPLDGGDEGPGQHVGELVLFLVGGMLHLMQLVQHGRKALGLKVLQGVLQIVGSLAGAGRAFAEVLIVKTVLFLGHNLAPLPVSPLDCGNPSEQQHK